VTLSGRNDPVRVEVEALRAMMAARSPLPAVPPAGQQYQAIHNRWVRTPNGNMVYCDLALVNQDGRISIYGPNREGQQAVLLVTREDLNPGGRHALVSPANYPAFPRRQTYALEIESLLSQLRGRELRGRRYPGRTISDIDVGRTPNECRVRLSDQRNVYVDVDVLRLMVIQR
jgi:hypothetical protein